MTKVGAELKQHEFHMACGELDEVFICNASVHIERMDTTAFWIGIEADGLPPLMLNTGVHRGTWFFNVEEDCEQGGAFLQVQRPRNSTRVPIDARAAQIASLTTLLAERDAEIARLKCEADKRMGHIADIAVNLHTPVGMNSAQYAKEVAGDYEAIRKLAAQLVGLLNEYGFTSGYHRLCNECSSRTHKQGCGINNVLASAKALGIGGK